MIYNIHFIFIHDTKRNTEYIFKACTDLESTKTSVKRLNEEFSRQGLNFVVKSLNYSVDAYTAFNSKDVLKFEDEINEGLKNGRAFEEVLELE